MAERRKVKHSIQCDSDSGAVVLKVVGDFTIEDATETFEKVKGLLVTNPTTCILADLSQSPNLTIDRETRRKIQEAGLNLEFQKLAFVGVSPVTRMIAKVVLAVLSKIKESRFFNSEEEALSWLKGE